MRTHVFVSRRKMPTIVNRSSSWAYAFHKALVMASNTGRRHVVRRVAPRQWIVTEVDHMTLLGGQR